MLHFPQLCQFARIMVPKLLIKSRELNILQQQQRRWMSQTNINHPYCCDVNISHYFYLFFIIFYYKKSLHLMIPRLLQKFLPMIFSRSSSEPPMKLVDGRDPLRIPSFSPSVNRGSPISPWRKVRCPYIIGMKNLSNSFHSFRSFNILHNKDNNFHSHPS